MPQPEEAPDQRRFPIPNIHHVLSIDDLCAFVIICITDPGSPSAKNVFLQQTF